MNLPPWRRPSLADPWSEIEEKADQNDCHWFDSAAANRAKGGSIVGRGCVRFGTVGTKRWEDERCVPGLVPTWFTRALDARRTDVSSSTWRHDANCGERVRLERVRAAGVSGCCRPADPRVGDLERSGARKERAWRRLGSYDRWSSRVPLAVDLNPAHAGRSILSWRRSAALLGPLRRERHALVPSEARNSKRSGWAVSASRPGAT